MSLVYWPSPILRMSAPEVRDATSTVKLLAELVAVATKHRAEGLAAPQIGTLTRVAVVRMIDGKYLTLINPEILERSGSIRWNEGCLSTPGVTGNTKRSASILLRPNSFDPDRVVALHQLQAVAAQHEIDHLDGVMFFDRVSKNERAKILADYARRNKHRRAA